MDLGEFGKRMDVLAKLIDKNSKDAVNDVASAVGPAVVYGTPVKTSRARANWQASVGLPMTGVLFPYPDKPPSPDSGGSIALESIRNATRSYRGDKNGIFIVNNLHYIIDLNRGTSTQAPAGYVEKAVVAGVKAARSVRLIKTF